MCRELERRLRVELEARESELKVKASKLAKLMEEVKALRSKEERTEENISKLSLKVQNLEDFKERNGMLSAQLKVQQWEVENYKQKLISQEITMAVNKAIVKEATLNLAANNITSNNSNSSVSESSSRQEKEYHEEPADYQDGRSSVTGSSSCGDSIGTEVKAEVGEGSFSAQSNTNLDRREAHAGSLLVTPLGGCSSSRGTPESSRSDVVWRSWASGKREAVAAAKSSAAPTMFVYSFRL